METTVFTISALLFLVSFGSYGLHTEKVEKFETGSLPKNELLIKIGNNLYFAYVPVILLIITLLNLINLSWYWIVLITIVIVKFFAVSLAIIYSKIFGSKTEEIFSIKYGGNMKFNIHIKDFIISLILGISLLIIGLLYF
ncbi:hypothetical protein [Flavobacterium covae]|uniref:hypothetical protein n=1 Tax=Flavobacterium covae TaxID=2906076 RepID=UPI000745D99E|nr:hypothetical protein [Flavobacterium covae]AMA49976.1 hypothetical protein AWN65_11165 [Flavobacterium covae]MCJ1808596.1 hypothetical protein [Flavobacterium covae]